MIKWFSTYDREDEGDEEHGVDLCRNEGEKRTVYTLVLFICLTKHSTQHTAHSTQHTAQSMVLTLREKRRERESVSHYSTTTHPHSTTQHHTPPHTKHGVDLIRTLAKHPAPAQAMRNRTVSVPWYTTGIAHPGHASSPAWETMVWRISCLFKGFICIFFR